MRKTSGFKSWSGRVGWTGAILLLSFWAAWPVFAEPYLAPGRPDGIALLAPPPELGSAEAAADLELSRRVVKSRTPDEEAHAKRSEGLALSLFAPAIGPAFDLTKLPKTDAMLKKVRAEIGEIIEIPKRHWNRKRPYELDPELKWGRPENSAGYPSGHSTRGTVYAMVLAEVFPEKKDAILEVGREIGWDRVVIGKHFLTDIRAGRVFGKAIVHELMASEAFQKDLAAAKAEVLVAVGDPEKMGK